MQRDRVNSLAQIGGGILALGIVIKVLLYLSWGLAGIAGWMIGIGLIVLIIGLVSPRR